MKKNFQKPSCTKEASATDDSHGGSDAKEKAKEPGLVFDEGSTPESESRNYKTSSSLGSEVPECCFFHIIWSKQGTRLSHLQGFWDVLKSCKTMAVIIFISVALNIYFIINGLSHQYPRYFCPDDWIGFHNNCYYFSKEERDWNLSRDSCISEHADLTIIGNMKEKDFLLRHKGSSDHWIGLKLTGIQMGKWVNGSTFSKWFNVSGNEECAYLNDGGVASARCYTERKWICRKNVHHVD